MPIVVRSEEVSPREILQFQIADAIMGAMESEEGVDAYVLASRIIDIVETEAGDSSH